MMGREALIELLRKFAYDVTINLYTFLITIEAFQYLQAGRSRVSDPMR
jgi:hypothetical protein